MPESVETEKTKTVANKNKVTIALDEYDDLKQRANRPVVNNVTVVRKTDQQNASDNMALGIALNIIGAAFALAGAIIFGRGKKGLK